MVNSSFVKSYILNTSYGYEKNKYGMSFHLLGLLTYHVIPRMRNANFVNKWASQYLWNGER